MVEFSTGDHFDGRDESMEDDNIWTDEVWAKVSTDLEEVARRLLAYEMEFWSADGKVYQDH